MKTYRIFNIWRQELRTPSRGDGEWHWHAPAGCAALLQPMLTMAEHYRTRRSSVHWMAGYDGFAVIGNFAETIQNRQAVGYAGYFIPVGDGATLGDLACDLPEILEKLPDFVPRPAGADEECGVTSVSVPGWTEITPTTRARPWALVSDAPSPMPSLAWHILYGGPLRTSSPVDFNVACRALASMIEWLPPATRIEPRVGQMGFVDQAGHGTGNAAGLLVDALVDAWMRQDSADKFSVWNDPWALITLRGAMNRPDLEETIARLNRADAAWESAAGLEKFLKDNRIFEKVLPDDAPDRVPEGSATGDPAREADLTWWRILNYLGRKRIQTDDPEGLKDVLAGLMFDRHLAFRLGPFRGAAGQDTRGGGTAPRGMDVRARIVVNGNGLRELESRLAGYFKPAVIDMMSPGLRESAPFRAFQDEVSTMSDDKTGAGDDGRQTRLTQDEIAVLDRISDVLRSQFISLGTQLESRQGQMTDLDEKIQASQALLEESRRKTATDIADAIQEERKKLAESYSGFIADIQADTKAKIRDAIQESVQEAKRRLDDSRNTHSIDPQLRSIENRLKNIERRLGKHPDTAAAASAAPTPQQGPWADNDARPYDVDSFRLVDNARDDDVSPGVMRKIGGIAARIVRHPVFHWSIIAILGVALVVAIAPKFLNRSPVADPATMRPAGGEGGTAAVAPTKKPFEYDAAKQQFISVGLDNTGIADGLIAWFVLPESNPGGLPGLLGDPGEKMMLTAYMSNDRTKEIIINQIRQGLSAHVVVYRCGDARCTIPRTGIEKEIGNFLHTKTLELAAATPCRAMMWPPAGEDVNLFSNTPTLANPPSGPALLQYCIAKIGRVTKPGFVDGDPGKGTFGMIESESAPNGLDTDSPEYRLVSHWQLVDSKVKGPCRQNVVACMKERYPDQAPGSAAAAAAKSPFVIVDVAKDIDECVVKSCIQGK